MITFTKPARASRGERIGLYGGPGVGKTSLALGAPPPVAFFDFDDSLGKLVNAEGAAVGVAPACTTFAEVLASLNDPDGWDKVRTLVFDSLTMLEPLVVQHVLSTHRIKGQVAPNLNAYEYGAGYRHLENTVRLLLQSFEAHGRAGRNVVLIMHATVREPTNALGEDFVRVQPLLMRQVLDKILPWLDCLAFLTPEATIVDGKAQALTTRAIRTGLSQQFISKQREGLAPSIDYRLGDPTFWNQLTKPKEGK